MNIVTDLSNSFNPYPKIKAEKKKEATKIKQKSSKLAKKERNRFSILQKDNTKCFVCGRQIKLDKHKKVWQGDQNNTYVENAIKKQIQTKQ